MDVSHALYQRLFDLTAHVHQALLHSDFALLDTLLRTHQELMTQFRQLPTESNPELIPTLQALIAQVEAVCITGQAKYEQTCQSLTLFRRKSQQIHAYTTHAKALDQH
jgi:hypothetical protein